MSEEKLGKTLSEQEKIDLIRLIRSKNVGLGTFYKLTNIYSSPTEALKNLIHFAQNTGHYKNVEICSEEAVLAELESCEKIGARIITIYDKEYPGRLKEISDPPPVLTVRGNAELLNKHIIAMVGARSASSYGCRYAQKLSKELGESGLVVASGLARGIDTASHIGSLGTGTIAVIAGGIDNIYPPENHRLYNEIAETGVIISELPFGSAPKSSNFPQRNRIISGISLGVIVVEASLKSGTLITTKFAAEQGREVFAVPGHPADPRSEGTLKLIDEGATSVHHYTDVLRELEFIKEDRIKRFGFADSDKKKNKKISSVVHVNDFYDEKNFQITEIQSETSETEEEILAADTCLEKSVNNYGERTIADRILEKIGVVPIFIEELIQDLGEDAQIINATLMEMELDGIIKVKNGKVEKL